MIEFSLVDVKEISSDVSRSEFDESRIEHIADLILESQGLLRPLILKQIAIDEFRVLEGHLEYYAAVRAREKDARTAEMVRAFVIPIKSNDIEGKVEEQIRAIREASDEGGGTPKLPNKPVPSEGSTSDGVASWISSFETRLSQMREEFGAEQRESQARLERLEKNLVESKDALSLLNSLDEQEIALRLARTRIPTPEKLSKLICEARKKQPSQAFGSYTEIVDSVKGLAEKRMLAIIDDWSRG